MKPQLAAAALALAGALAFFTACPGAVDPGLDASSSAADGSAAAQLLPISVVDLLAREQANEDLLVVNVHTPHGQDIAGTDVALAYDDVPALVAYLGADLDRKVVLYCMSNSMSTSAGAALVARGYRWVRYLDGGLTAWVDAGLPLSTDAGGAAFDASVGPRDAGPVAGPDASSVAGPDAALGPSDASAADAAAVEPPDAASATLGTISIAELWTVLQATPDGGDKGFLLLNVHVPYQGNIPGTDANITYLDPNGIAAYVGADLDRPVVVYCMSNYMSTIAGNDLVARGYRAVRYLDGGMSGWSAAGHPLDP